MTHTWGAWRDPLPLSSCGSGASPRFAPGAALLQDGARNTLSVNSGISTPGGISSCKSPVETGFQAGVHAIMRMAMNTCLPEFKPGIIGITDP